MNLFKKMMTGVAVGALTLAVAGGIGSVSADAASVAPTVNAAEQTITVPRSGNNEVMVAYPTVKNGTLTVKSWDVYETPASGNYVIDVSALNSTKDNYVMLKSESKPDPVVIKFAAVNSKIKAAYNAGTAQIAFTGAEEDTEFQYRTASGSWAEFANGTTDLTRYEMSGTTVYFRETPNDSVTAEKEELAMGEDKITVSKVVSFGGKEIKVKVTKRANGPKATVDLDAGTYVVAKKGTAYRNGNSGTWQVTEADKEVVTVETDADGVFEVKTAKVVDADAKKSKPESKITQYAYAAAKSVTVNKAGSASVDIKDNGTKDADGAAELTFSYQERKKPTDEKYPGITIKNAGDAAYQVVITTAVDNVAALKDTKTYKPTAVAAGKEVKIAASKLTDGDMVYVRYASDKKTGAWASKYVLIGKVSLVAPVEPTE